MLINNMNSKSESIDFVPDEVLKSREEQNQYTKLFKFGLGLLVLFSLVGGGLFVYKLTLKKNLDSVKKEVLVELRDIDSMKEVAKSGYSLGIRLSSIDDLLKDRILYSNLMKEISDRTPSNILLDDIVLNPSGKLALSGVANSSNYTPISDFKNSLSGSDVFSDIKVLSASGGNDNVRFSMSLNVDIEKLKESFVVTESSSESSLN